MISQHDTSEFRLSIRGDMNERVFTLHGWIEPDRIGWTNARLTFNRILVDTQWIRLLLKDCGSWKKYTDYGLQPIDMHYL